VNAITRWLMLFAFIDSLSWFSSSLIFVISHANWGYKLYTILAFTIYGSIFVLSSEIYRKVYKVCHFNWNVNN